jgi:hypothetical protein
MARGKSLGQLVVDTRVEARMDPDPALSKNMQPLIKQILRREQERLWEEFDWPFGRIREDIPLQAGERYYDVPATMDLDRIESVHVKWGDRWFELDRGIDPENYNFQDSDLDARAEPVLCWDIHDTGTGPQIEIWPIPPSDDAQTVRITGIRKVNDLVNDADVADLDDRMLSLFVAAELLASKDQAAAQARQAKAIDRFNTLKGRSVQKSKGGFNLNGGAQTGEDNRRRTPLVAYVRNP